MALAAKNTDEEMAADAQAAQPPVNSSDEGCIPWSEELEKRLMANVCEPGFRPEVAVIKWERVSSTTHLKFLKYVTTLSCSCVAYASCKCGGHTCACKDSQLLGDEDCNCGTRAYSYYGNQFIKYDPLEDHRSILMSWAFVFHPMSIIGRKLIRTLVDRFPDGRLIRVPQVYFLTYLEGKEISHIRATGIPGYFEGKLKSDPSIIVPLSIVEIDALRVPGNKPIKTETREMLVKNDQDGSTSWVKLPAGGKQTKKEEFDGLHFFEPIEPLEFPQEEGSLNCIAHSAASLLWHVSKRDNFRRDWFCLGHGAMYLINEAEAIPSKYHTDRDWYNMIQQTLKDYGWQLLSLDPKTTCIFEVALRNPRAPHLVLLKSENAYGHAVGIVGNMLFDCSERVLLLLNRHNLDLICGGPGCYKGFERADEFFEPIKCWDKPGLGYPHKVSLYVPTIENPFVLRKPATYLEMCLWTATAAVAHLKWIRVGNKLMKEARTRSNNGKKNHQGASLAKNIDEAMAIAVAEMTSQDLTYYKANTDADHCEMINFIERMRKPQLGLAQLKGACNRHIFVSWTGDVMFVPWLPVAIHFTYGNVQWVAQATEPKVEWVREVW